MPSMSRRERDAVLRTHFFPFLHFAFEVLEPETQFVQADYLHVICRSLMKVTHGETRRLIVNMPPRHLKSVVCSVAWVAWMLMRDPSTKIAIVCHGHRLADELALKCKRLIGSDWFVQLAPNVGIASDQDRLKDFATTRGGRVYAASIDSGITGTGFDVIILDDPQAANTIYSEVERQRTIELFDSSLSSRLNDVAKGKILLVQQRLHEGDLSGHLLARGGYTHLCMPLVARCEEKFETDIGVWSRPTGHILCPERIGEEEVAQLRVRNSPRIFETQWQQAPSAVVDSLIRTDQIRYINNLPISASTITVSVDTATKALPSSSFTVFLVIASDGQNHYIINVIRSRLESTAMRDVACNLFESNRVSRCLIEDTASGHGLHHMLMERGHTTTLVSVGVQNKIARLESCLHYFAEGRVFIVGNAPCMEELRDELLRFPETRWDDQVDALTNYLLHSASKGPPPFLARGLNESRNWPKRPMHLEHDNPLRPRRRR